ncbi:MAG: SDR family NAD(P)-dependent oxidoreductase [Calditrichaeota bacterium]|nr:MAG: SDR family NAD(P)-dependent oxidoreductase [Calditrichota bacterium]
MARHVFITGATGNVGRAVCSELNQCGYRLLCATRNASAKPDGCDAAFPADLTNEADTRACIDTAVQHAGSIEAAVLTVGGFMMGDVAHTSLQDVERMIQLNFHTVYNCVRPLWQHMKQNGFGRVVLVGARPGLHPETGAPMVAYTLSKSLVFALARLLNADGAASNTVCSVVIPSIIDTPQNRRAMPEADYKSWVTPREIARVIAFALEEQSLREPLFKVYGAS